MSAAIAGLGLAAFGTVTSIMGGNANRKAQGRIDAANLELSRAQTKAENEGRKSRNIVKAAQGSLARYMMGENNKRMMDNAGKTEAAARQTMIRIQDSQLSGSIEDQISAAEQAGAFAANAAFNGTGGNAVDIIDMTMRLKNSRAQAAKEQNQGYVNYDSMAQIAGIVPQSVAGLDVGSISDGMDLSESFEAIAPVRAPGPSGLGMAAGALSGILSSQFLKPAVQQIGDMFKTSSSPYSVVGEGLKLGGGSTSGFSFNDTGAGTAYRLN